MTGQFLVGQFPPHLNRDDFMERKQQTLSNFYYLNLILPARPCGTHIFKPHSPIHLTRSCPQEKREYTSVHYRGLGRGSASLTLGEPSGSPGTWRMLSKRSFARSPKQTFGLHPSWRGEGYPDGYTPHCCVRGMTLYGFLQIHYRCMGRRYPQTIVAKCQPWVNPVSFEPPTEKSSIDYWDFSRLSFKCCKCYNRNLINCQMAPTDYMSLEQTTT